MPRRGGRRKKTRTHVRDDGIVRPAVADQAVLGASEEGVAAKVVEAKKIPKSIVVRHGRTSRHLNSLVEDLRKVMNPHTAVKLKERKNSSLRDYTSVAGPLGVTHIMVVTQATKSPSLKIARMAHGPTLTFRISQYSLSKDIRGIQKKTYDATPSFLNPPLVVLNNFESEALANKRHLKVASLTFQSMFPAINVQTIKLSNCRRVLLFNLNEENDSIEVRHYLIRTKIRGVSKPVKQVIKSQIPNLGDAEDISDILTMPSGYATSDSEDDAGCVVSIERQLPKRKNVRKAKAKNATSGPRKEENAVRLSEIGPRLTLDLLKVEDGLFTGEVQYHAFEERSKEEIVALRNKHKEKTALKEERKRLQEENVKRKQDAKTAKTEKRAAKRRKHLEKLKQAIGEENGEEADNDESD